MVHRSVAATSNFREHKAQTWLLQQAVDGGMCDDTTFAVLRSDNTCAVSASTELM